MQYLLWMHAAHEIHFHAHLVAWHCATLLLASTTLESDVDAPVVAGRCATLLLASVSALHSLSELGLFVRGVWTRWWRRQKFKLSFVEIAAADKASLFPRCTQLTLCIRLEWGFASMPRFQVDCDFWVT